MLKRALNIISSLKLTVVCLSLAMVVTFVGTLAQVKLGLWVAQEQFFRSIFVWWGPQGADWKIPVLPGGWLLGSVLLINLLAAHAKRFKLTRQKAGIFLIHGGLILLLVGQFLTEVFQVESVMQFAVGQSRNFSESQRDSELVFIDKSDPAADKVVAIPEQLLRTGKEIQHPELPFKVRVHNYWVNSEPVRGGDTNDGRLRADQGVGRLLAVSEKPFTAKMDDRNIPAATLELGGADAPEGMWLVTPWAADPNLAGAVIRQFGAGYAGLSEPQDFTAGGRTWEVAMRFERHYKPHTITLLKATHQTYPGRPDLPKDFRSRVAIENHETGEQREQEIFMNSPLRYGGETYYQFQMGEGGPNGEAQTSALQVVRNPAWLTPYVSCIIVGVGLAVQFLMHLVTFARRISPKTPPPAEPGAKPEPKSRRAKAKAKAAKSEPEVVAAARKAEA
jgi:hypothetical protein